MHSYLLSTFANMKDIWVENKIDTILGLRPKLITSKNSIGYVVFVNYENFFLVILRSIVFIPYIVFELKISLKSELWADKKSHGAAFLVTTIFKQLRKGNNRQIYSLVWQNFPVKPVLQVQLNSELDEAVHSPFSPQIGEV